MAEPTVTPTNNPVPSKAGVDLIYNAQTLDIVVNSQTDLTTEDRFGREFDTMKGYQAKVDNAIAEGEADLAAAVTATGYFPVAGSFEAGGTITERNQYLQLITTVGGNIAGAYTWGGPLPKVVGAGNTPASTGGVSPNAWVYRSDSTIRSELALGTADVGGAKSADLAKATINVPNLKALASIPVGERRTDITYHVMEFDDGTGIGGHDVKWMPLQEWTSEQIGLHWPDEALEGYEDGDKSTLYADYGSGVGTWARAETSSLSISTIGHTEGDTSNFSVGLNNLAVLSDEWGAPVIISSDIYANLNLVDLDIWFEGKGSIRPFSRTSVAFAANANFSGIVPVTSVTTFIGTVNGQSAKRVSLLSIPSHDFVNGEPIRVVAEDIIPSCDEDGTRSGEYATVLFVSGSSVYLDRELDNPYTTGIRAGRPSKKTFRFHCGVRSSTGNETKGGVLALVKGYQSPNFDGARFFDNDGPALVLHATKGAFGTVSVGNLTNNTTLDMYGYGVAEAGTSGTKLVIVQTGYARHAYTTIAAGNTDSFSDYGEPDYLTEIRGTAENCTSNAWDTHEQGNGVKFIGVQAVGCRSYFQTRCRNTFLIDGFADNVDFGVNVRNITSGNRASLTIDGLTLTNCEKPFNFKDDSGTDNKPNVVMNGMISADCNLRQNATLLDSQGDVIINGEVSIFCNSASSGAVNNVVLMDSSVPASVGGKLTINGSMKMNTVGVSAIRPIRLDRAELRCYGSMAITATSLTNIFTAADAATALDSAVYIDKLEINNSIVKSNWFQYPVGFFAITATNSADELNGSASLFINTGTTSVIPVNSNDPAIFVRLQTAAAPDNVIDEIEAGKFIGQTIVINNNGGSTCEIAGVNILNEATLTIGDTATYVWRSGWVLTSLYIAP